MNILNCVSVIKQVKSVFWRIRRCMFLIKRDKAKETTRMFVNTIIEWDDGGKIGNKTKLIHVLINGITRKCF